MFFEIYIAWVFGKPCKLSHIQLSGICVLCEIITHLVQTCSFLGIKSNFCRRIKKG